MPKDAPSVEGTRASLSSSLCWHLRAETPSPHTHPLSLLVNGHSGPQDSASPSLQILCLEIYTLPQTSCVFATHTSRFSNKCLFKEFPSNYTG